MSAAIFRNLLRSNDESQREPIHRYLRVVDTTGQPVEEASIVFDEGPHGDLLEERTTDEQGLVDLPGALPDGFLVIKSGYGVTMAWSQNREIRMRPLVLAQVQATNVPVQVLEDFELFTKLDERTLGNAQRDCLAAHGLLPTVPLVRLRAELPVPCLPNASENVPGPQATILLLARHRRTGRFVRIGWKCFGNASNWGERRFSALIGSHPRVVFDVRHSALQEWVHARVHLPDDKGGKYSFYTGYVDQFSQGHTGSDFGMIQTGSSSVDTLVSSTYALYRNSRARPLIHVERPDIVYRMLLDPIPPSAEGNRHVELWPRHAQGVLEIEVERHPEISAAERLRVTLDRRGDGESPPTSMWHDLSQTLGEHLVRIYWLPTSAYQLSCSSKTGRGLSIKVRIQDHSTTRIRIPIAPEAHLQVSCYPTLEGGTLRILHEETGHIHLGNRLREFHTVPRRGRDFSLPVGRYLLTFNRNGHVQQKAVRLEEPRSFVSF